MVSQRPRLLALGFYAPGTGLSRVMEEVLEGLRENYQIDWLGLGYQGDVLECEYTIHPTNQKGGDIYGAFQAKAALEANAYQVVLILADIWQFEYYARILGKVKADTRFVAYIPLDGNVTNPELVKPLALFDDVVVYTQWAADQLQNAFKQSDDTFPKVDVIGHGVNVSAFHPVEGLVNSGFDPVKRTAVKASVFSNLDDIESSFIVLNPSRPADRKHVDLTILSFAEFCRDKPDNVKLCLHNAIQDQRSDEGVASAIRQSGVQDRIIWNPFGQQTGPVSDEQLNRLYQACDLGLNSSSGEGWGLVSFEHAATGAAQMVPDHSACGSLWQGYAQMIGVNDAKIPDYSLLALSTPRKESIVEGLERMYTDRSAYLEYCQKGFEFATQESFHWQAIRDAWASQLA